MLSGNSVKILKIIFDIYFFYDYNQSCFNWQICLFFLINFAFSNADLLLILSKMDRIIVLEKGKIVEEETHKELLRIKGKYYDLWQHQSKGVI